MLEWFRCPDKKVCTVKECLAKCRMDDRCQPIPYLHLAASEREWTGTPSTTQLLNGTMQSFLKITQPYVIDPDDMAFAIHGTKSHEQLEVMAKELGLPSELSATHDGRNVVDLIEVEDGLVTLTDYKTWGSYKVMTTLGIVMAGKKPNPNGEKYAKSGAWGKAGTPKMVNDFKLDPSQAGNREAELQLNRYRLMLEDAGIKVDKMRVHAIVRDGGLAVASSRGIERKTYLIPIKMLDDNEVRDYFEGKESELAQALALGGWDIPCNEEENWGGTRCKDYCEVARNCPKGVLYAGA